MSVNSAATIEDLRRLARRRVPDFVYAPIEEGTGDGRGPAANVASFSAYRLVPRIPEHPVTPDLSATLFGRRYAAPFGISAIGYAGKMWAGADIALAEVAVQADIPFILSASTVADIETIVGIAGDLVWQQLYPARDTAITDDFLDRGAACGVEVLVQTVDMPASPAPNWVVRTGIKPPLSMRASAWPRFLWQIASHPAWCLAHARAGGMPRLEGWARYVRPGASAREVVAYAGRQIISGHGWKEVERVRNRWPGKLVVKGVLRPEDAARAFALGADAVTISNHGGNRMETMIASLDALALTGSSSPSISPGKILFDGGIRCGADIAVARALGADFSFIGRAALFGLLAGGRAGALKATDILISQLDRTLRHLGVNSMEAINADHLQMPEHP